MVANSRMKPKFERMLAVIKGLMLNLLFTLLLYDKVPFIPNFSTGNNMLINYT